MSDDQTNPAGQPPGIFDDVKPAASPEANPAPADPNAQPNSQPAPGADASKSEQAPADPSKPDDKPPEQKSKEDERVVPEKYALKLSDGSILDPGALGRIEAYAKANKLTQEEAAGLVQAQEADVKAFVDSRKSQWLEATKGDKELGGEKLNENVQLAKRFLDTHASMELKQELDKTGYGNHPEFMRFVVKLAKMSGNDKAVVPNAHAGSVDKPFHESFYGPDKNT